MVRTKVKSMLARRKGFTIVELLIVIIVIGVLATITIISYAGVTTRANLAKAQTNAETAQKIAETFNADCGWYPQLTTDFTAGCTGAPSGPSAKLPSGMTVVPDAVSSPLTSSNGITTVAYACNVSGCTKPTGGRISYYNYGGSGVVSVYIGVATSSSTFYYPTS